MANATATRKIGDKVGVDHPNYPGIWTVKKVNPTTLILEQDGNPRPLKCPKTMITDAPALGDGDGDDTYEWRAPMLPATVVRYTGPNTKVKPGLYVVTSDKGEYLVRVTRLGGDNGHYWRLPGRYLAVVDAEAVLAAYVKAGGEI